jgi:hypothetical protein
VVLEEGGPPFNQRFAVAIVPDMPRGWVDPVLQQHLMQWPPGPGGQPLKAEEALEVNLGPRGLSVMVQKMPEDMAQWQHLAALGDLLAARLAASAR